jgi:hypothetical protein
MHAYVFVYSPSKFKVGAQPLVRFEAGGTYTEQQAVISSGTEGVVERGIYVIGSDAADMEPGISAVGAEIAVDFDQYTIRDKDPWPEIIGERSVVDPAMRTRVCTAFPDLLDEHLQQFLVALGVSAA